MKTVLTLTALLAMASSLSAQPSSRVLRLQGDPQHGYIEIPADALLDTPQMTIEAWVSIRDPRSPLCSSIAGNGYQSGWWLGICGTLMRSYFNGGASQKTGGEIPADDWVHIAAVTDGTTRKHYINGNLVFQSGDAAPRSISTKNIRIGSDPDWDYMVEGRIEDLRIWRVARTQEQIRQTMFALYFPEAKDYAGQFQSLEAWYRFDGDAMDSWRTHHGTIIGAGIGFESGAAFGLPRRRAAVH